MLKNIRLTEKVYWA